MISYNDLYEVLRKEKNSENLQMLQKTFLQEVSEYLNDRKETPSDDSMFLDSSIKSKKQLENFVSLFKELILRRKKKILHLVFVAAETGIMKRDYDNMLPFEKDIFEKLTKAFEEGDKSLAEVIRGSQTKFEKKNKMILFTQDVEKFIDLSGGTIGPFVSGELAALDSEVSEILVSSGKANYVDD